MKYIIIAYQYTQQIELHFIISKNKNSYVKDLLQYANKQLKFQTSIVNFKSKSFNQEIDLQIQNIYCCLNQLPLPLILQPIPANVNFFINENTKLTITYFKICKLLGEAEKKYDRKLYSIKVMNKQRCLKIGELQYITNEIGALKYLRQNPHILRIFFAFEDKFNVYIVLEYCPGGDLFYLIKNQKKLSEDYAKAYFIEVLSAIQYVHENFYVYRDLKPENILLDSKGYLKLSDFGFVKKCNGKIYQLCGSYEYMAPQMIKNEGYTFSYDIYTLGILLFQMLTGDTPFKGQSKHNIKQFIGNKIQFPTNFSSYAKDLVIKLTNPIPEQRLGAKDIKEIRKHQWLQNPKKIARKKMVLPFLAMKEPFQKEIFQFEINSQIGQKNELGIRFNYMSPVFDVQNEKLGPKLHIKKIKNIDNKNL